MWRSVAVCVSSSTSRLAVPAPRPQHCILLRWKGHSKWDNIRHIKAANDAEVSRLHSRYAHLIRMAIRENGMQTDPALNRPLAKVMEEAASLNVRKHVIENAIASAKKSAEDAKEYLVEILGPGRCAILVEAIGRNRQCVDTEVNKHVKKHGGMQQRGLSSMFDRKGVITVEGSDDLNFEKAEDIAIECGAEEVDEARSDTQTFFDFYCSPEDLMRVKTALTKHNLNIKVAEIRYEPQRWTPLKGVQLGSAKKLLDALHDCPAVLAVHHNIEMEGAERS